MGFYLPLLVLHILSAVVWLSALPSQLVIARAVKKAKGRPAEGRLTSVYISISNIFGIVGMSGIIITGVFLVFILPYYSFFDFSSNHWLAAKQVIIIILAPLVFGRIIPLAKKIKKLRGPDSDKAFDGGEDYYKTLKSFFSVSLAANILVLINFLLAVTHRFI
jgi:uncharacterized membrane protein